VVARRRVLVVGTVRSGTAEHPATRAWLDEVARARGAVVRDLPPLDAAERARLMEEAGIAAEHARALASRLDQPTVVVLEAVRDWIDRGMLVKYDDDFHPAPAVTVDALARSAPDALGRRVGALLDSFGEDAPRALRTLIHAALLGICFEERALRECSGSSVDDVLDRALLVGILRVQQAGAYRFEHQLYAEHLGQRLAARPDRSDIQRTTASTIEALYGELRPDVTAAPHLFRAAGDFESAYESADRLVRTLTIAHMFAEADEIIATIGRWAQEDEGAPRETGRAYYHLARGRRAYHGFDHATAIEEMTKARAAFTRAGIVEMADEATRSLATAYFFADQPRRTEQLLTEILPRVTKPRTLAMIHHHFSEIAQLRCDIAAAIAHERVALASEGDEFICAGTLAALLLVQGSFDEAEGPLRRFRAISAGSTRGDVAMALASLDAIALCARGRFEEAVPVVEAWLRGALDHADTWQASSARAFRAVCAAAREPDEAVARRVADAIAAYRAVPHDELQTWWAIRASEALLRARGMAALARDLGAMLDARQEALAG